jgi:hypothetical protein
MTPRRPPFRILIALVGVIVTPSSAPASLTVQPVKVTSSIDGKKVLPLRIRWLAYPRVPMAQISEVDFLIDGKLRCIEHSPPYNYGSDDFHGHLGYLVTTWLSPGRHRFTVRAVLTNGRKASHTVIARVLPAPEPPPALAGRWQRTVTDEEVSKVDPRSVGDLPTGKWELVFDRIGAWNLDPAGSGVVEHVNVRGDTIGIDAAVWMTAVVNGHGKPPLNRYGYKDIGAGWREDGPPGSYTWSVSGKQLTLTAIRETSGPFLARRAVWEGIWTRVG